MSKFTRIATIAAEDLCLIVAAPKLLKALEEILESSSRGQAAILSPLVFTAKKVVAVTFLAVVVIFGYCLMMGLLGYLVVYLISKGSL